MKIAFDNQIFNQQQYGGISRYIAHVAEEFYQLNHDVKIFAGLNENYYLQNLPSQIVEGKHINFPPKTRRIANLCNRFISPKAIKLWQPKIIHKTYYDSRKFNYPTVITVHDMIHELFADNFSLRDKTSELKRTAVNNANHIIAISHSTKSDLINLFNVAESKITVVSHGFDKFETVLEDDTNILADKKPYILYVGQRQGYKNFQNVLKAYANSPFRQDFNLVAFGGGKFNSEELVKIRVLNLKEAQVQHIGGEDSILGYLYNNAIALMYPSLYEGFGMPPLEAMAHNCPVICSNTSSIPEVVGDAGVYFAPTDIDDIQDKLESVLQDTALQNELRIKGQQRIQQFSWQKCASETLQVYQKII